MEACDRTVAIFCAFHGFPETRPFDDEAKGMGSLVSVIGAGGKSDAALAQVRMQQPPKHTSRSTLQWEHMGRKMPKLNNTSVAL